MQEPSKKAIKQMLKKEQLRIAELNKVAVSTIGLVRKYTNDLLPLIAKSKKPSRYYKQIENYLIEQYGDLFKTYKQEMLKTLNEAGIEQRHLVELTLAEPIALKPYRVYKSIPKSTAFSITNKILSEKSVLQRDRILARRVTTLIANNFDKDLDIKGIQKKLDIELGFRNKKGVITEKATELIKQGKFAHSNGHIYETYRIARTETMRMSNIQQQNTFDEIDDDRKRMKLISVMDKRTRKQSEQMNGQVSNEKGEFLYPDGKYYRLGFAPAKWSINDRETSVIVFID